MGHSLLFQSWVRLWGAVRQPVILAAVLLHFSLGLLCFCRSTGPLLQRLPVLDAVVEEYRSLDLAQTWRMFAPPAQSREEIQFALELPGGWTPLLPLDHFLVEQGAGHTVLPGGYLRLANHFRHPNFEKRHLREEVFFWQYFQSLAAFYCRGDGRLAGIRTVRFYSVTTGIEPFFPTDRAGHTLPKARDFDKTEALYERSCA